MAINGFLMTTVYAKINYKPYNWLTQWKFNPNNEMNSVKKRTNKNFALLSVRLRCKNTISCTKTQSGHSRTERMPCLTCKLITVSSGSIILCILLSLFVRWVNEMTKKLITNIITNLKIRAERFWTLVQFFNDSEN